MFCLVCVYCLLFSFYNVCWCGGVVIFWGVFILDLFYFFKISIFLWLFMFLDVSFFVGCFISDFVLYNIILIFWWCFVFMCFLDFWGFYLFFGAVCFGVVFLTFNLYIFLFCQLFLMFSAVCFLSFNSSGLYFLG